MSIANKLSYLNDTKEGLRIAINQLGGRLTKTTPFRNYADGLNYLYSKIPKVEAEGENITFNDVASALMKLDLKGNTSQNTTTGYNKLGLVDGTYTENSVTAIVKDGKITISGTASTTPTFVNIPLKKNLTFTNGEYYSLYAFNNSTNSNVAVRPVSTIGDFQIDFSSLNNKTAKNFGGTTTTISNIVIRVGTTSALGTIVCYPMIISGNDTTKEYEPYTNGASPNPSYPQPINVVSGDNDVVVCGKNLFDKDNMNILNGYLYGNQMNISTTRQDRIFYIPCKPSTTYTISRTIKTGSFRAATYNSTIPTPTSTATNYTCYNEVDNNNGDSITITTDASSKYLLVHYGNTSSDTNLQESINTIQVEVGSTALPYEPYQSQTYEVDLPVGLELCKIGDYQDYFTKNSGKNLLKYPYNNTTKETNGITFTDNGDGTITISGTATGTAYFNFYNNNGTDRLKFNAGTYTFSITDSLPSGVGITYGITDNDGNAITGVSNAVMQTTTTNVSRTINQNFQIFGYIAISNGTAISKPITIRTMLEANSTATTYEPYGTGLWCKYNAIGKVVLDGSETWSTRTSTSATHVKFKNENAFTYDVKNRLQLLSNYFVPNGGANDAAYSGNAICGNVGQYAKWLHVSIDNTIASDVASFKTWLGTHNLSVYYILNTPYLSLIEDEELIEQLDNLENAMSYEGQTNISQVNNDKAFIISAKALTEIVFEGGE